MVIVAAIMGVVYFMVDTTSATLRRNRETAETYARVKQALIGWAVGRPLTGSVRPGELPCPDMNNDGLTDVNCVAGAIGRVPWKTLGIPEPKDAAGETLWYAIAGPFRDFTNNTNPIHSDTKGNLTVYQDSTASAVTTQAIAVLFAPGETLGAQDRDTVATALCPTTGTTIARNLCAANYLETAATVNNSTTNGPFISALSSNTFNDKVMAIATADLMPLVEQVVAREALKFLVSYKAAAGVYPWADCSSGNSDYGDNRGRIPIDAPYPQPWGYGGSLTPPGWFSNRGATNFNWAWVIHYAVGRNFLEWPVDCTMCETVGTGTPPSDGTLSVNGAFGKELVIIMTGPAGASRPGVPYVGDIAGPWGTVSWVPGTCEPVSSPYYAWQAYLEDSENYDYRVNDRFVTPSSKVPTRDRLYFCPGTPGIC